MFKLTETSNGSIQQIHLEGTINEEVDFSKEFTQSGKELHVYCKAVDRLNSTGVKHWCQYFEKLRRTGVKLKFIECSPAITEQSSYLANFMFKSEVVSVVTDLLCENCNKVTQITQTLQDLAAVHFEVPATPCPTCSKPMELDQMPLDYLGLLKD